MSADDVATELAFALRDHAAAAAVWAQLTDEQRDTYRVWIGKVRTPDRRITFRATSDAGR